MVPAPVEGRRLLIKNVRIFDGISDHYFTGDVLIEGTKVAAVETSPIAEDPNTVVIDGADRVLVPGMSDAHVHLFGLANTLFDMMLASQFHLIARTLARAKETLLRGLTTVRDMAGDTAGVKNVINGDPVVGPRIYPSQAAISQTAGPGDF